MRWWTAPTLLLAGLGGCGRIGFSTVADRADAPTAPDGMPPAPVCEQAWMASPMLTAPQPAPGINVPGNVFETGAFLGSDGLTLYFGSTRAGAGFDAYMARRGSPAGTFDVPVPVPGANTAANDYGVTLDAEGLEAFLSSDRGGADADIYRGTRATTSDPFGGFAPVATINAPVDDYNAVLSSDGRRLYFATADRAGGPGGTDLMIATRATPADPFGPPAFITELDTAAQEASPTLIASERVILFTSDRPGTSGTYDVWYATRASTSDPFGTPLPVPGVSTPNKEWQPFLRADGCELFFTFYDGVTVEDIYVSQIVL